MGTPRHDSFTQLQRRLDAAQARINALIEDPNNNQKGLAPTAKWAFGELWRQGYRPEVIKDAKDKPMVPTQGKRISDPTAAAVAKLDRDLVVKVNAEMRHKRRDYDAALAILETSIPKQLERAIRKLERVIGITQPRTVEQFQHQEIQDHNDDLHARRYYAKIPKSYITRAHENQAKDIAAGGGYGES